MPLSINCEHKPAFASINAYDHLIPWAPCTTIAQREISMELSPHLAREFKTITAMVKIYCRNNHHCTTASSVCEDCSEFIKYARQRLSHCPFEEQKPTCGKCTIHCYKKEMQTKAKQVMRYSGPRMVWNHPLLAFCHLLDGRKKVPDLRSCQQAKKKHQS